MATKPDPTSWKTRAKAAVKAGYIPGNAWERMLARHLNRLFPEKVAELQKTGDLEAYLRV
jgi:hypothetical protein